MQRSLKALGLGAGIYLGIFVIGIADTASPPLRTFGLGELYEVAISPDSVHLATAGQSGAFLWEFEQGTVRYRLDGHGGRVSALCFSPDSRVLLTGGLDRSIRAWEVESGEELRSFAGHEGQIMNLAFAADGLTFVSTGDNTARVWSLGTGEELHRVEVPGWFVRMALFTPQGNRLVTSDGSHTNNVRLWDLASETTVRTFGEGGPLGFVAGGHLVTAGPDQIGRVWNVETGNLIRSLAGATEIILDLSVSTDGSTVIAGCQDGRIIAWNAQTGAVVHNHPGEWLASMSGVPGTNQVLTANSDNLVRLRELATGSTLRTFVGHTSSTTTGVDFSPDGRFVVSGGTEAATRLWNRTNGQLVRNFVGHEAGTATVAFSPDGSRVLTTRGYPQPSAQLWNTESGQLEREFVWSSGWPTAAALSKDGGRLAAGLQDGKIHIWDVATGASFRTLSGRAAWVTAVAFAPDGKRFASGGSSFRPVVDLWDLQTGQSLRTFELEAGSVTALDFSPSSAELLVAWEDGVVRLFDVATGDLRREMIVPAAFLNAAVYAPNGEFILTGEGWPFFTATLWDARTGEMLRVFTGHRWSVDSVAFDPSGRSILTGSDIVRLWNIDDLAVRLQANRKPNGLELQWNFGTLQHSPQATGPWLDLTNATSPWTITKDQSAGFFRIKFPVKD